MKKRNPVFHFAGWLYKITMIVLTLILFVVVTFNVFTRYVLNNSMGWADELSRFVFIWVCFLGATLSFYHDEHVGLSFVLERIRSIRIRGIIKILDEVLIMLVLLALVWYGWIVAISATNVSPALYIPMKYVYMIVPFCGTLMAFMNLAKMADNIRQFRETFTEGDVS